MKKHPLFALSFLVALLLCNVAYSQTTTYNYTGGVQTYVVPNGVTSITIDMAGGQGGWGVSGSTLSNAGGLGGRVTGTISVTAGSTLDIYVGNVGSNGSTTAGGAGGYNGGAVGGKGSSWAGGGGGGASDIRVSPYALANRIAVAGGGGGGGFNYGAGKDQGGLGGGSTGGAGYTNSVAGGTGAGKGGTQSAGGAGGVYSGYTTASAGTSGNGGAATAADPGGGGGGGYFGGGGGVWEGGGGGSSYPTTATLAQGYESGAGYVKITPVCGSIVTGTLTQSPGTGGEVCTGTNVTYTISGNSAYVSEYFQYAWNSSTPNSGSWGISGNGTNSGTWTSSPNGQQATLYVDAVLTNACGATATTNVVNVKVDNTPTVGTLAQSPASGTAVCQGTNVNYTISGNSGYTSEYYQYQWNASPPNSGSWGITGNGTNSGTWGSGPNGNVATLYVDAVIVNGACSATTNIVNVVVDANSSYGTINGASVGSGVDLVPACGYNGGVVNQVSLSGYVGSPVWYYETGEVATTAGGGTGTPGWSGAWVSGANAGTSDFPINPVANSGAAAGFEAVVTNGACPSVTTPVMLIQQENNPAPTSLTSTTTAYCSASAPSTITLTATYPYAVSNSTYTNSSVLSNYSSIVFYSGSCGGTVLATVAPASITYNVGAGTATATCTITAPTTAGTYNYYTQSTSPDCSSSGCTGGSVSVVVTAIPATPGAITGTSTPCPSVSQVYSIASVPSATTYTWSVPTGWNITAGGGTNSITVTTGSYGQNGTVSVTAGNLCGNSSPSTLAVTVNPPAPSTPTYTTPVTYCANVAISTNSTTNTGGAATYTASSLPAGLSINSSSGDITGTPTTTAGIAATNYTVTATNSCGVKTEAVNITISPGSPATLNYTPTVSYCANNPIIPNTTSNSGGAATFTVSPALPAGLSISSNSGDITGTPTTVGGVATATYTVTATNSCGAPSQAISITINPAVTTTVSPTTSSFYCAYANSNVLSATPAAGTPGYTYTWSNGLGNASTATPGPGASQTFSVTVTDAAGCTVTATTGTIAVDPVLSVSPSPATATTLCSYATTGAIGAGASGGSGVYSSYTWNNGLGTSSTGTPVIASATVYSVTVIDNKGCSVTGSTGAIGIDAVVTAVVSPSATTTYCPYATSNVLNVVAGGGTSGYTYAWSNGLGSSSAATPSSTSVIVYTVTVTDSKGCTATGNTGSVNVDPAVTAVPTPSSATLYCSYANSGVLHANAAGGSSSYTYAWSNGLGSASTASPTLATATTYTVTVTDTKGCTVTANTGSVTVDPAVTVSPTPNSATLFCSYANSGVLAANAGGGTAGYTYVWSNSLGTGATATPTSSSSISYTVTVTDSKACTATGTTSAVVVDPAVTVSPTPSSATFYCSYATTNVLAAGAGGGTAGYTYVWSNGLGTASSATPLAATSSTYSVTVTDSKSCSASGTTGLISVNPAIIVSPTPSANPSYVCSYSNTNAVAANASGGSGTISTYAWNNGLGNAATGTPTITTGTVYTVTVTDSKGCTATGSTGSVLDYSPPTITGTTPGFICGTGTVNLGATSSAGVVNWWPTSAGGTPPSANTGTSYTTPIISSSTTYYVNATANGCTTQSTTSVLATVYPTSIESGGFYYSTISGFTPPTQGIRVVSTNAVNSGTVKQTISGLLPCTTYYYQTYIVTNGDTVYATGGQGSLTTLNSPATITLTSATGTDNQAPCYNVPLTTITYAIGGGATFATVSGLPSGITGSYNAGVFTISGTSTVNGTYNYTITTTGTCAQTSATGTIISYPNYTATQSGGSSPLCYNTSPGVFTATGTGGTSSYTYQWYNSSSLISGATSSTYNPGNLTASASYSCSVTSGSCGTLTTGPAAITVEPPVTSYGTLSASGGLTQTVCINVAPNSGNPILVTGAAGSSGSFTYQWYYKSGLVSAPTGSSTSGWTACGATQGSGFATSSFTAAGSSSSITYACFVIPANPVCGAGQWATNDLQVTVLTTGPTETSSGGGNVCLNGGVLLSSNLSAVISATYQWYSSTSPGFSSPTTISGATATTYAPPTSASGTLYYEVVATFSGSGCTPATSNAQTVIVYTVPSASQTGGSSPICDSTDPGTFTAIGSGGSGSFSYVWYNNSGAISGATSSTYDPGILTASNAYHCTVTDVAGCGANATTPYSVIVDAALTASQTGGTTPICYNTSPGIFTATASGGTGSYTYQWYDGSGAVPGETSSTYNPGNLTSSSNYFCSVTSGTCGSVKSSPLANITVRANLTANISGGTSPICYNTPPGTFRIIASGGTGTYTYQWWNTAGPISGATASSYAPGNLTVSDIFHCNVSSGVCGAVNSASVSISVDPILSATIAGGTTPICYGADPGAFTATGAGGTGSYTYQWYNTTSSISGQTASTYDPGNITASNNYRCSVTSGTCGTVATSTTSISVNADLTATISGGTSPTCYNTSPGTFTATSAGGTGTYSYQWYNANGVINGSTVSTYTPGNLTASNAYHCAVTSGSCGTVYTSAVTINVDPAFTASASNTGPYVEGQNIDLLGNATTTVSYQWSGPQSYTSGVQNPVISGATTAMAGIYNVTATNPDGCTATASTNVVVTTNATYTWTGTNGTTWTDPNNWSPPAPVGGPNACAIDIIIPSVTNNPIIASAVQVGNVQMNSNAKLTLTGANINVCKNWTGGVTKALVIGTGTVVMNGSSSQTISGKNQIQEMMVDNAAGVNMASSSTLDVYTSLDLKSGNMDVTNGTITFKSATIDSVAILDNFSAGYHGTITGNINAERYYASSLTYDQHYMGSPVNTPSLSQFNATGTPGYIVDPTCDETHLPTYSPYGTFFSLNESHGRNCGMQQWKAETPATLPNAQNAVGYSLLKSGAGTLSLNGTANLNASYSVTGLTNSGWTNHTAQNRIQRSGWQLLSNPYLAPVNLTTVPAGFDNQVQVWNADGPFANSYQPYTIGVDAGIAPFQAFMVHKTSAGGTATFTVNASDRVRAMYAFHAGNANQLNIVAANTNTGKLDQTTVAFDPAATDTFDAQMDASKLPGSLTRHTLYTVNNSMWMSRNVLNNIATTSTVPMGFEPGVTGTYTLTFNGLNTFDPTSYIYLEDKALNIMYNTRNGDYTFTADSADDWDRFVLHFTPPVQITSTDATCEATGVIQIQQPGTANWNYTLTDAGNAIITSGTLNQSQQVTVGVPTGTYTLTLIDTNNYQAVKTITVNGAELISAAFDVPPTAIQVNQPVTLNATTPNAVTYQWNFGNGTSSTGASVSATYTQPGVYSVSLQVTSSTGCISTKIQSVTVNAATTTGLSNLNTGNLEIWSHGNKVYVDFTGLSSANATVIIYDILGQEISNEKVTNTIVYQKEIDNIEAAYMIVMVKNDNEIITKKVLISNVR